jgi:PhnB protein
MKSITTYLAFDGSCLQAMTFYEKCLEAELELKSFAEMPGDFPKEAKDRIMHARLTKGSETLLMASDGMAGRPLQRGNNFSVAIACESLDEIERLFTAFAENAKVTMPLHDAFWGSRFGMLTDQFGINWMFNFEKQTA